MLELKVLTFDRPIAFSIPTERSHISGIIGFSKEFEDRRDAFELKSEWKLDQRSANIFLLGYHAEKFKITWYILYTSQYYFSFFWLWVPLRGAIAQYRFPPLPFFNEDDIWTNGFDTLETHSGKSTLRSVRKLFFWLWLWPFFLHCSVWQEWWHNSEEGTFFPFLFFVVTLVKHSFPACPTLILGGTDCKMGIMMKSRRFPFS